jgi:glutamate racemase
MKIGVFDSGIGGRNVLRVLEQALPEHQFVYASDSKNVPYGNKTPEQIVALAQKAVQPLLEHCGLIVLACNTATSYAIDILRAENPKIKFVGLEPAVKPAAEATKNGVVAVCATPATLASPNYQHLKSTYAKGLTVIEPDCSVWAGLIEQGSAVQIDLAELAASLSQKGCDTVALGCTHYHSLKQRLAELLPGVTILEPSDAVVERVKRCF